MKSLTTGSTRQTKPTSLCFVGVVFYVTYADHVDSIVCVASAPVCTHLERSSQVYPRESVVNGLREQEACRRSRPLI